uniref:Ig-like domain-containing protein n=1 Tax=Haemonchus contortus TaxID=6289 RepID=A0A7I5E7Z2_HAECO
MLPRLLLWCVLLRLLPLYVTSGTSCDLFWSSRQSLGYEQGIQLQVCCNVSSVKIWAFKSAANFQISRLVFESDFPQIEDDPYSELQLSMCSDRSEPTIGWVGAKPGVNCTYSTGQTLNIPHGAIPIPDWYVICYTLSDGCQICRLDILCENDLTEACADLFILGSSPRASNSTIDYWIKAGDNFPFPNSSQVELTTSVQRNSIPVDVRKLSIAAGEKKRLTVSGLKANEVYDIRRCVEIRLSPALTQNQQFNFTDTTSRLCSEEGYRTQPNVARIPHPLWIALITILLLVIR